MASPQPVDLAALVGLRFPEGAYEITVDQGRLFRWIVDGPDLPDGLAHPAFCHLATHVGKGVTFAEFAELVGSSFDAGFLFGGGSWEFVEPLRTGVRYVVRGGITAAESRVGHRTGRFDLITTELDLVDPGHRPRASRPPSSTTSVRAGTRHDLRAGDGDSRRGRCRRSRWSASTR